MENKIKNSVWSALILIVLILLINVRYAEAVPDIRGEYSGSYTIVVSNCSDSSMNGTYNAVLALNIPTQTGSTFSGTATGTINIDGLTGTEYIQLSGTINETGQISGNTSHTFLGTGGEGTFTGQLSGDTLSIENPGHDTYGDICTYIRYMSATREGIPPLANFSTNPISGKAPLSVNFTDESTGSITSWNWNFGDGTSSTLQNPSHTYNNDGNHSISLTVSGPNGSDTKTKRDCNFVSNNNELKIMPCDDAGNFFSGSVSISGSFAIVGAPVKNYNEIMGAAYIFEISGGSVSKVAKLTASDGSIYDRSGFGWSVSISGNYAIVGAAYHTSSWFVYIFERSGNNWNQMAKLTASDGSIYDRFGSSVSISGDYAIVGAGGDRDNGFASGSAYIFERSGSNWIQVAKLTENGGAVGNEFGLSVSISGDYAIVGAQGIGSAYGSAYIFERSGNNWNQVTKLPLLGNMVSISGNYAIVSFPAEWDYGSTYIYERSGSNWNQMAKLTTSDWSRYDRFGSSVSISGDYAIVSAVFDWDRHTGYASGYAYIYERSGSNWNQVAKLTASDGFPYDYFGQQVSISGDYAIVGAPGLTTSGSAYIFEIPSIDVGVPHSYDSNQDWSIGDFELLDAIDAWATGSLGDFDLLDLIDFWAAGCFQWDAADGSYKAGC